MGMEPPDWLFQNIVEASKHSSRIHGLFVGFVFFCALTLFGTSDRQIILDEQTHLPLLGTNVSFSGFCWMVVVMGICIFTYLQVYLQELRRFTLRAKNYPLAVPDRIYPWVVTIAEERRYGIVGVLERIIIAFSLWYLLPVFFSIIPIWFVRTHSPLHSYVFALSPVVGMMLVIAYRSRYERMTLWQLLKARKTFSCYAILIILWSLSLILICIPWAMRGKTLQFKRGPINIPHKSAYFDLMRVLGSWWCVDLSRQNLVKKPEIDFPRNHWVELSGVHLEGANLIGSVLKRANLEDAQLQHAFISGTSFEEAFLERANLSAVLGDNSNFEKATFYNTNLKCALLPCSNFRNAQFGQSNMECADLAKSNLEGANLYNCRLHGAQLSNANLHDADLRHAKFHGACLTRANLQNTQLSSAELDGAYLFNTDLRSAKELKVEQLCKAGSVWNAQIDEAIMSQVETYCPSVLEKPQVIPTVGVFSCHEDVIDTCQ